MVQKKIVSVILIFSSISYGDCDWKTISKTSDGYLYSKECHLAVGKSLDELDIKRQQSDLYKNSSELFKQAYELEKQRSDLWYKQSQELEKTIRQEKMFSEIQKIAYFSLGSFIMYSAIMAVK